MTKNRTLKASPLAKKIAIAFMVPLVLFALAPPLLASSDPAADEALKYAGDLDRRAATADGRIALRAKTSARASLRARGGRDAAARYTDAAADARDARDAADLATRAATAARYAADRYAAAARATDAADRYAAAAARYTADAGATDKTLDDDTIRRVD